MSRKTILATIVILLIAIGLFLYWLYIWINAPTINVYSPETIIAGKFTIQNEAACKVPGSLCWSPARGFFDYDTQFYVYKKDKTCNLDYHVEQKNNSTLELIISEVRCDLKGADANDGYVFNIMDNKKHELSELKYTYKFHDGSPDSHNIINLVK